MNLQRRGSTLDKVGIQLHSKFRPLTKISKTKLQPANVDQPKVRKEFPETWIWDDLEIVELVVSPNF
jgi:hypothetical protein